jgi:hypothetical protein
MGQLLKTNSEIEAKITRNGQNTKIYQLQNWTSVFTTDPLIQSGLTILK